MPCSGSPAAACRKPPFRLGGASVREQLESLVAQMIERGLTYDDAHSAFEKAFFARALACAEGNIVKASALIGVHRNTLGRKAVRYRLRVRA